MAALAIILQCIAVAIAYGIVHDMVTAHLCVEYFTIGHPPVFATQSPVLLALGWGIIATWWAGAILGIPMALAARVGRRPKLGPRHLWRPLRTLIIVMGLAALASGITGYLLGAAGIVELRGWIAQELPPARHNVFLADLWAHSASYLVGFVGGVVVIVQTWRRRGRMSHRGSPSE